jgi:hypothetical protein
MLVRELQPPTGNTELKMPLGAASQAWRFLGKFRLNSWRYQILQRLAIRGALFDVVIAPRLKFAAVVEGCFDVVIAPRLKFAAVVEHCQKQAHDLHAFGGGLLAQLDGGLLACRTAANKGVSVRDCEQPTQRSRRGQVGLLCPRLPELRHLGLCG